MMASENTLTVILQHDNISKKIRIGLSELPTSAASKAQQLRKIILRETDLSIDTDLEIYIDDSFQDLCSVELPT